MAALGSRSALCPAPWAPTVSAPGAPLELGPCPAGRRGHLPTSQELAQCSAAPPPARTARPDSAQLQALGFLTGHTLSSLHTFRTKKGLCRWRELGRERDEDKVTQGCGFLPSPALLSHTCPVPGRQVRAKVNPQRPESQRPPLLPPKEPRCQVLEISPSTCQ